MPASHIREPLLLREEKDASRIVHWPDAIDTDKLLTYYKQRLGPGIESLPSVSVLQKDWFTLFAPPNGNDIYMRLCHEDESAAKEISFYYDTSSASNKMVKFVFHIETPNPGQRFLAYLDKHGNTEFLKELLKNLMTLSRQYHELHLQWKSSPIKYHRIAIPEDQK